MIDDVWTNHKITVRGGLIILLLAVFLTSSMLWPLFNGHLWIIDDHEIVQFTRMLHDGGSLSLANFWIALSSTELTSLDYGRYRPVYYSLRILKSAIFGDNAGIWFCFNAILLFLSFIITGICLKRYFSWFWVVTGIAVLAALPFHAGLWGRLGPSEIDPVLWGSLALLGVLWHRENYRWGWPLFCIASALSIGSKENFILLVIPAMWLLWLDWQKRSLTLSQFIWLLIPFAVSIPVGIILFKSVFITGTDIYGVSTGGGAFRSAGLFLVASGGAYFSYALLAALLFFRHNVSDKEDTRNALGAWGVIFLMLLGNYAFYRGDIAGLNRYGVPYQALLLLEFFIVLFVLKPSLSQMLTHRDGRALFVRWPVLVVCGIGGIAVLLGLSLNTMRVANQVWNTRIFADFLKTAQNYKAVGVITTGPALGWTFEPLHSLRRYHQAGYIPNIFYLPVFGEGEGQGLLGMETGVNNDSGNNRPLTLEPDVVLVEFGPPNKRVYLGSFWGKVTYFTHPWTNPHWFRIIEHSNAVRPMAGVLADRPILPLTERGEAIFEDDTILYVPADHPQPGTLLLQTSAPLPADHCWRFTVNGQEVQPNTVPQGIEIAVDAAMWANTPHHPQVLEVGMTCSERAGRIRTSLPLLALMLSDLPS